MTVLSFPKGTYHQSLPVGNSHWGKGTHKTFGDYCTPGPSWHGLPSTKVSSWTPIGVGLWGTGNGILIKIQFTVHPLVPWILQWSFLQSWVYNQNWYIRAGLTVHISVLHISVLENSLSPIFESISFQTFDDRQAIDHCPGICEYFHSRIFLLVYKVGDQVYYSQFFSLGRFALSTFSGIPSNVAVIELPSIFGMHILSGQSTHNSNLVFFSLLIYEYCHFFHMSVSSFWSPFIIGM